MIEGASIVGSRREVILVFTCTFTNMCGGTVGGYGDHYASVHYASVLCRVKTINIKRHTRQLVEAKYK